MTRFGFFVPRRTALPTKAGDIVVVSIPLKNYCDVPVPPLTGKIVIDTNNCYPQREGNISELDEMNRV